MRAIYFWRDAKGTHLELTPDFTLTVPLEIALLPDSFQAAESLSNGLDELLVLREYTRSELEEILDLVILISRNSNGANSDWNPN